MIDEEETAVDGRGRRLLDSATPLEPPRI
ncbi:unnamed protein product [Cyprideis torosa]|uniref:Uncharacterized protein n=1 Tax=Cyprideis torosa TaxID=163714 RepID=A0A7R8ZUR7_9CRUS|nr:unnamed protein product [Cyprideis torosa]CAG0909341.1 unnamed protein product [Cyprideis torosa]